MIIASIVLVLAALYGGQTLGSWFFVSGEVEDTEDNSRTIDFEASFNLEGYEYEVSIRDGDDKEKEDGKIDYDDNDCSSPDYGGASDCDEMYDLMQGKIQNLLYVVILAGGAALYFLNNGDEEKGSLACLAMGGAGLLAVVLFTTGFPEALDDDTDAFEIIDEDPSVIGDNNDFGEECAEEESCEVNWRPGFAFALVGLSGILGMAAFFELKN
jgi:hypothetical protein